MATMPTIDFGSRSLAIPGDTIHPNLDNGSARFARESGAAVQRAVGAVARGLYDIAEIKDRADARDATYAMHQAENWFNGKWNGTDTVGADGKTVHTAGVADRSWREMEADGTDSAKECLRLKREFRESDIYQNLGAGAKAHFDRQFAIYEGRLDNEASRNQMKLSAQKIKDQTEADLANTNENVAKAYGADYATFDNSAQWGATQATRIALGSLCANAEYISANGAARLKDMVFRGGRRYDQLNAQEKAYVDRIYNGALKKYYTDNIQALQDSAATGQGLGAHKTANDCLSDANEMISVMKDGGILTDAEANALTAKSERAKSLLATVNAARQRVNDEQLGKDFKERIKGLEDTRVAFSLRPKMESAESYAAKIDAQIEAGTISEKAGEAHKQAYRQLLDHIDTLARMERAGQGVWTKTRDSHGNEIEVFQPYKNGSGKDKADAFFELKYNGPARAGEPSIWDDPSKALDDLDTELKLGMIPVKFYDSQVAKAQMLLDPKAKAAYMEVFGADENFTASEQKDTRNPVRRDQVWAKNRYWAGNINDGPTWREDALTGDGGETEVTDEQRKQIYQCVLELTREGIDPRFAVQSILAPTIKKWQQTDLANRLNPMNLRAFQSDILRRGEIYSGDEGNETNTRVAGAQYDRSPAGRKARTDARIKQSYEGK